jgi:hypothetical protein
VRNIVLVLAIAAAATPAYAQVSPNMAARDIKLKTDVEIRQEQEREAGYKAGVSKIPDAKGKADPWGGVRGGSSPAAGQNQSRSNGK